MKIKVRSIHGQRKVKLKRMYDLGGVYPSQKEMDFYFMVLGNVDLCRLIKLNLPRTAKMQRYLDRMLTTN